MSTLDRRSEIRDFLSSRRARISPEQAGLPAYGRNRRVKGLRREEVAMLAGVSVDYYVRMERGSLSGASEGARGARVGAATRRGRTGASVRPRAGIGARPGVVADEKPAGTVRPALLQILDAITDAPAWIRNGRHDVLAMNQLRGRCTARCWPIHDGPANTTRFVYLDPEEAERFFVDYDKITRDAAAMLRLEAGQNPYDEELVALGRRVIHSERVVPAAVGLPGRAVPPLGP